MPHSLFFKASSHPHSTWNTGNVLLLIIINHNKNIVLWAWIHQKILKFNVGIKYMHITEIFFNENELLSCEIVICYDFAIISTIFFVLWIEQEECGELQWRFHGTLLLPTLGIFFVSFKTTWTRVPKNLDLNI